MQLRKGYLYALLLAVGLLLWSEVLDPQTREPASEPQSVVQAPVQDVWQSSDALYECAIKAQEYGVTLEEMYTAPESMQGSLALVGEPAALKDYYSWLEDSGRFRAILSFELTTEDEKQSRLNVSFAL